MELRGKLLQRDGRLENSADDDSVAGLGRGLGGLRGLHEAKVGETPRGVARSVQPTHQRVDAVAISAPFLAPLHGAGRKRGTAEGSSSSWTHCPGHRGTPRCRGGPDCQRHSTRQPATPGRTGPLSRPGPPAADGTYDAKQVNCYPAPNTRQLSSEESLFAAERRARVGRNPSYSERPSLVGTDWGASGVSPGVLVPQKASPCSCANSCTSRSRRGIWLSRSSRCHCQDPGWIPAR